MLAQHRDAFFEVATTHHCWIGLRDPNALADPWIGRQGCYPKPITCKAKTADVPGKPFSGLVVSPWILDDHFSMSRLDKARRSWEQFQGLLKESDDPDPSFQAIRRVQTLTTLRVIRLEAMATSTCSTLPTETLLGAGKRW